MSGPLPSSRNPSTWPTFPQPYSLLPPALLFPGNIHLLFPLRPIYSWYAPSRFTLGFHFKLLSTLCPSKELASGMNKLISCFPKHIQTTKESEPHTSPPHIHPVRRVLTASVWVPHGCCPAQNNNRFFSQETRMLESTCKGS